MGAQFGMKKVNALETKEGDDRICFCERIDAHGCQQRFEKRVTFQRLARHITFRKESLKEHEKGTSTYKEILHARFKTDRSLSGCLCFTVFEKGMIRMSRVEVESWDLSYERRTINE